MQYGFYFDQTRCIGCNACSVSCKDWHHVNPGPVRWRKQQAYESISVDTNTPVFNNLTMACNHCAEPACLPACAVNAISKLDNGIVLVDRKKCIQLRACISACPFSALQIADDRQETQQKEGWQIQHPVQKCTYCWERVTIDEQSPVCVAACPTRALQFGDIDVLLQSNPDAVRLNQEEFPYAYKTGSIDNTIPSFAIKKKTPVTII